MSDSFATPTEAVIARVKAVYGGWRRATPVAQMRDDWDRLFAAAKVDAQVEPARVGGVPGEWVMAPHAQRSKVVLYLHGGGFRLGSTRSHRELMACISAAAGCAVLGIDYRLIPEHRFPTALDDTMSAYEGLLALGYAAADVALAGDSAGGGLALSTLLRLRDQGRALPAAAAVMSAWTDLSASGESYETRAAADPIHQRPMIQAVAANYLDNDTDPRDPQVSPLFAPLHGLPPLLMQVGDRETVLSDTTGFAQKAQGAGVPVQLEVWDGMIHVFQQFPSELAEAREAVASIGRFLRQRLGLA